MESIYEKFLGLNIDLSPLGMERRNDNEPYFCTPLGAEIIGWAGVDGIHFCFVRDFGEMVFAVSPMNGFPDYVHPLAKDFADFLRLLLVCGDSAALEQAWQWNAAQFHEFLSENPPTDGQKTVLDQIASKMGLAPMEYPWQYIIDLQAGFDYDKIPYSEEYYDLNPDAHRAPPEWKVYFDGSFWGHEDGQRPGKKIRAGTAFDWAGHHWVIPAIYSCAKGLVVDFCMRVEPDDFRAFMETWDLTMENESSKKFTPEERMRMELDNPVLLEFTAPLRLNGKALRPSRGSTAMWNPCISSEYTVNTPGQWAAMHYDLDQNYIWVFCRSSYPWATKTKPTIKSLSVTMMQEKVRIPGPHFSVQSPGDTFTFTYPEGAAEYTLTVQEYEAQTLDTSRMPDELDYPTHHYAMSYTITPDLPGSRLTLEDCARGDRPRQKPREHKGYEPEVTQDAAVIGIIGGADGPTAIIFGGNSNQGQLRAACSSLHFEPKKTVEWRMVFHEKQYGDMTVELTAP